ncbi:MAG: DJ-1 family glyoxalase III [Bacteroidales bacterium]
MKKIFIFLADGFEEGEMIIPLDTYRRSGYDVTTVSITGSRQVISSHKVEMKTDTLFENADFSNGDVLFLPGGMPGTLTLNAHQGLKDLVMEYYKQGKLVTAICAGPMVLGGLGILKDRNATCYPGFEDKLIGAKYTGAQVEVSDNIVTGRGVGAGFEFALTVVGILEGPKKVEEVTKNMVIK